MEKKIVLNKYEYIHFYYFLSYEVDIWKVIECSKNLEMNNKSGKALTEEQQALLETILIDPPNVDLDPAVNIRAN